MAASKGQGFYINDIGQQLHQQIKIEAAKRGVTMRKLVIDAITASFSTDKDSKAA